MLTLISDGLCVSVLPCHERKPPRGAENAASRGGNHRASVCADPEGSEPTDICDEEHRAYFARLKEPAETVGLNMQLPPEIRPRPMTYLAFEGAVLAENRASTRRGVTGFTARIGSRGATSGKLTCCACWRRTSG